MSHARVFTTSESVANKIYRLDGGQRDAYIDEVIQTESGANDLDGARFRLCALRDGALKTIDYTNDVIAAKNLLPESNDKLDDLVERSAEKLDELSEKTHKLLTAINAIDSAKDAKLMQDLDDMINHPNRFVK